MTKIVENEWHRSFKKDIAVKFEASNKEFKQYKKTGSIIYLQQAGEKLFSAIENYLMLKHDYCARGYADLYGKVKNNKFDLSLLKDAFQLHKFFYNGDFHIPVYQAEDEFVRLSSIMKSRFERIRW